MRWLRRRVKVAQLDSELHQRLLEESKMELVEMEQAWEIRPEELDMRAKMASGSFGDVWRAEWNDLEVAVKCLKEVRRFLAVSCKHLPLRRLLAGRLSAVASCFTKDIRYIYIYIEHCRRKTDRDND